MQLLTGVSFKLAQVESEIHYTAFISSNRASASSGSSSTPPVANATRAVG